MAKPPYNSAGWRAVRLFVLDRDGYRCRIRLGGCTDTATTVDHIVTVEHGGAWLDPLNLRAACQHCNSVRGNKTRGRPDADASGPAHLGPSRDW